MRLLLLLILAFVPLLAQQRPNVLFIVSDDLNNDLGTYGHPTVRSPNIDRLADRGVQFNRAYCQWPACAPSRNSFMTGLYPEQTGVLSNGAVTFRRYHPELVTLPQLFRQNGYYTARVGKIFHYGVPGQIGTTGADDPDSWDEVVHPIGRDKWDEPLIYTTGRPGNFGGTLSWFASDGADSEQTDAVGAGAAIRLLEKHQDEPFFIAMGFYRPHTPYVAPRRYYQKYPLSLIRLPVEPLDDLLDIPAAAWVQRTYQEELTDFQQRQAIQGYYAAITFLDAQIGRLLDALDRLGLAENTIVVFFSDHGYHMGEHKLWQKTTLFENSARVPLLIAAPGFDRTRGSQTGAVAELIDVYPTLADLAGLEAPDYLAGASLRAQLEDVYAPGKAAAMTTFRSTDRQHTDRAKHRPPALSHTIRTERWRYTEWGERGRQGVELYDHRNDPKEFTNLANDAERFDTVRLLEDLLATRIAAARRGP